VLLLALETATEVGSVALFDGADLAAELEFGAARHHAASVLGAIERVLEDTSRRLDDVERIALSIGPGSFTGLRVGLATALGLCFDTDRLIWPVPTLAALALRAGDTPLAAPLLDARRGQVYAGLYAVGGVELESDRVTDPLPWLHHLAQRPETSAGGLTLLGPGARLYRNEIATELGDRARVLPPELGTPRASCVGRWAIAASREVPPGEIRLRYLRPSDAEVPALER
jgi:tRNA threonylcarbamoyladenosine biosynthesis protein TsaB